MTIAVTFDFSAQGDQIAGWSETYYSSASTTASAYILASKLNQARAGCLSNSVSLTYCKLTPLPIGSGVPLLINCATDPNFTSMGALTQYADFSVVKGLMRLVSTVPNFTRQWLGGIPSFNFTSNGAFNNGGPFKTAFNAFLKALTDNSFCIRKVNNPVPTPPNQGGYYKQVIQAISVAGVLTVPNSALNPGDLVYVGRTAAGYGLRGFWHVQSVVDPLVTLQGVVLAKTPVPVTKTNYIQKYVFNYPLIAVNPAKPNNINLINTILRSGKHAVGRPKNPSTGRRKRPVK